MVDTKREKVIKRARFLMLEANRKLEVAARLYRGEEDRVRELIGDATHDKGKIKEITDKSRVSELGTKYTEALSNYRKLKAFYEMVKISDKTKPGVELPLGDKSDSQEDEAPSSPARPPTPRILPVLERPPRPIPILGQHPGSGILGPAPSETSDSSDTDDSFQSRSDSESYWDRRIRQGHWKFRDPLINVRRRSVTTPFWSSDSLRRTSGSFQSRRDSEILSPPRLPFGRETSVTASYLVIVSILLFLLFVIRK